MGRWARAAAVGVAALGLLGSGCASGPRPVEYDTRDPHPETPDGLRRVRTSQVGAAWVKPGASFAGYDSVVIDPVTVSYKHEPRRADEFNRDRGNFALGEAGMERLERIFQESFERELSGSRQWRVVSEPGPSALRVSGHIVNLVVDVPPGRPDETLVVVRAGEMTLILDVRDSQTGAPLARVADRRAIQPGGAGLEGGYRSSTVAHWGAVRDTFAIWARFLREGLDDLRELPPGPPPGRQETDS